MARSRPYGAHDRLTAPLRPRAQIWRFLLGLGLIGAVTFALNRGLLMLLLALDEPFWSAALIGGPGNAPLPLLVMLGSFGFVTIGVWIALRLVHGYRPPGILGPLPPALRQFRAVIMAMLLLGVAIAVLPPYQTQDLAQNLPPGRWLALLPFSLLVVLVQASAEEILFRGYMQQVLAARFASPLIWMAVPTVLFALGHYQPAAAGGNAWPIVLWAGIFGLLMADLTARAGTLGPAIAVHFVNNATALLLVSLPDSMNGLALYVVPYGMADAEFLREGLVGDFAVVVLTWLAARVAIRR
ncbi:CPBP family intramembrane glutamic endopeptidase [Pontibaca methylaminivorans]|uniref:CPBP family intramembrane glutamic endopeptidase n=1 Tax=Pontibaca methylaminivorans TaxID=515897 RepID=UPI002FDA1D24